MSSVEKETNGEERTKLRFDIPTEPALGTTATERLPERSLMPVAISPDGSQQRFTEAYRYIQETDDELYG